MNPLRRRTVWIPAAVVLVLLVGGGAFALVRFTGGSTGCVGGDRVVPASQAQSPILTGNARDHPHDPRLARLVATARTWQLGPVVGAVGYDYGQWLTLAGLPYRLGVWTKRDPVFRVLDPVTLRALWGIRQSDHPHAYDASTDRLYEIEEPTDSAPEVSAYSLADGHRLWCTPVGDRALRRDDPMSTLPTADGELLVLAGRAGHLRLSKVGASVSWSRPVSGVDRGDYLAGPWHGLVLAGGRPQWQLGGDGSSGSSSAEGRQEVLAALDPDNGAARWRYAVPAGTHVHVLGTTEDRIVLLQQSAGGQVLVGLGPDGTKAWSVRPQRPILDAVLRSHAVVTRDDRGLTGYAAGTGHRRWNRPVAATPQPFPYGFTLDQQPMLDSQALLIGGTRALLRLDLATGHVHRFRLPTDGINTTFWPYQMVVADGLLAVVTNTGAVLLRLSGTG